LVGLLVAVGLSSGGGDSGPARPAADEQAAKAKRKGDQRPGKGESRAAARRDVELRIAAGAEVWVCLLDADGKALVDGVILPEGAQEGPWRSRRFTVALGNGAVEMTLNGKPAEIPETSSPIGFEIDPDGELRELPEGERPTCT